MPKKRSIYIRNYYLIALFANLLPILIILINVGSIHGESQMGFLIFFIWEIICCIIYSFYYIIPELKKNWEKITSFIFPTFILSLVLFKFPEFKIVIAINFSLNLIFIIHWTKHYKN